MGTTGPGWYRDPAGAPIERWWDGVGWTPHTQPLGYAELQRRTMRSAKATGALARLILWILGIVVGLVVLVAVAAYVSVLMAH